MPRLPRSRTFVLVVSLIFVAITVGTMVAIAGDSRLSCAVALVFQGAEIEAFLKAPDTSYVQTYFRFGEELADDVIFGVDQEFIEGVDSRSKPHFIKGGDWMAFVGLQRTGAVWIATGTDATMAGKPSKDRTWKILQMGTRLKPDTWYRMRCYANFRNRHFERLEIEGPGIEKSFDLSSYGLDYPNYMPFDGRAMSYYVFAMRGRSMMKSEGVPVVFFDDVEGGVKTDGKFVRVFFNDFEAQKTVGAQPVTLPVIKLGGYEQGKLYLERDQSRIRVEQRSFAKSGKFVGAADASLN